MQKEIGAKKFMTAQWAACKAFLTYIRFRDLWSALYSIIFVLTASLWFGRIPKMPAAFLVCLPFIYLSVLGALLLFLGELRDRYIGEPRYALIKKLLGPKSVLAGFLKHDGERMLRTAFAVGFYLFLGLLYLALGPSKNNLGWLLMPCVFVGMAAVFTLNQRAMNLREEGKDGGGDTARPSFRTMMVKRAVCMVLLVISLYIMVYFLVLPLHQALLGQ
ncbi:MAG: hypothetical protein LBD82_05040 [Deltaproteobacteria bacterium]|nr:hypothetical protein [Deltaproteobacteria bacterium]